MKVVAILMRQISVGAPFKKIYHGHGKSLFFQISVAKGGKAQTQKDGLKMCKQRYPGIKQEERGRCVGGLFTDEWKLHDGTSHPLVRRVHSLTLHIPLRRAGNEPVIITALTLLLRIHALLVRAMILVRHRANRARTLPSTREHQPPPPTV